MMNHMRRHFAMIVVAVVVIAAGYMAYQRYYVGREDVQIQNLLSNAVNSIGNAANNAGNEIKNTAEDANDSREDVIDKIVNDDNNSGQGNSKNNDRTKNNNSKPRIGKIINLTKGYDNDWNPNT